MPDRWKAVIIWRLRALWDGFANLPTVVRVASTKETRGLVRAALAWRAWVATHELREEIKKAPADTRARLVMQMQATQNRRWRITIILTIATVVGLLFAASLWGDLVAGIAVIAILVVLYYLGNKPDKVVTEVEAPKTPLQEGMPLSSLRESIQTVLAFRSKTEAHVAVQNYEYGWRFQLTFLTARPDDDKLIRDLEQGLGAPAYSITMVEDPANASRELGTIQLVDPLDKTPNLSVFGPNSLTITEPLPVGMNQDGSDLKLNALRTNWLFVGRTDSGKSTALNAVGIRLSECKDVHLSSIDITGAPTFAVHRGCIRRRAERDTEAVQLLKDELAIIDIRTRRMTENINSGDVVAATKPTVEVPARVLLLDELPALADNKEFIHLLQLYLMRGRKVNSTVFIGTQGVAQQIAGSATFREAVAGTILFACGTLDIANALGQNARSRGWRADMLYKSGTCYVRDKEHRLPAVSRFSYISVQDVADRSIELQHHQPASSIPEVLSEVEAAFDLTGSEKLQPQELVDRLEDDWTVTSLTNTLKAYGIGKRQFTGPEGRNVRGFTRNDVTAAIERLGSPD